MSDDARPSGLDETAIFRCLSAGVPASQLIPVLPPHISLFAADDKRWGIDSAKCPAHYAPTLDQWFRLDSWQHANLSDAMLRTSAMGGANAGLVLGAYEDPVLSIDVDLEPGPHSEALRDAIVRGLRAVAKQVNATIAVRSTVRHRAMVLMRLPPGETCLRRACGITLDSAYTGKIEILGNGQQVVIAGVHRSGAPITWEYADGSVHSVPDWSTAGIPRLGVAADAVDLVAEVLKQIEPQGLRSEWSAPGCPPADLAGAALDPDLATPPSIAAAIAVINMSPNPANLERDAWVALMMSFAASIHARHAREPLSLEDFDRARQAAIDFTMRWEYRGPKPPDSPEAVGAKWDADLGRPIPNSRTGWISFLKKARMLCAAAGAPVAVIDAHLDELRPHRARLEMLAEQAPPDFAAADAGALLHAMHGQRDQNWESRLRMKKVGKSEVPMSILLNACIALQWAPEFERDGVPTFRENQWSCWPEVCAPPPWHMPGTPFEKRELSDNDIRHLVMWFSRYGMHMTKDAARDAILIECERNAYNPMIMTMDRLAREWDKQPRLDRWLIDYFGAEDTPLNRAISAVTLIGMAKRVYEPGCQHDTTLVLEGPQDIGKSSGCRIIAGRPEYFSDDIKEFANSKDDILKMQSKLVIEDAESAVASRSVQASLKAFMTRRVDECRPPYGMGNKRYPRRCIFIITYNPLATEGYLTDVTGNRRYLTVQCAVGWEKGRKVDRDAFAAMRDQIVGEAVFRYQSGEVNYLNTPELVNAAAKAAEERSEIDVWTDAITAFVDHPYDPLDVTRSSEILEKVIHKDQPLSRWTEKDKQRVAAVLHKLGWKADRRYINGKQDRYQVRLTSWHKPPADLVTHDIAMRRARKRIVAEMAEKGVGRKLEGLSDD